MVFKFTILSDESEDFLRIIEIDADASFLELQDAILESVQYEKNQMTSFFICTDDWEKGQEITLVETESSSEYDNLIMENTHLNELLEDEKQKMLFVFDMISDRAFFIELSEIILGKNLRKALMKKKEGKVPKQIEEDNFLLTTTQVGNLSSEENFYGDEDYNIDELDEEGFADLNFDQEN